MSHVTKLNVVSIIIYYKNSNITWLADVQCCSVKDKGTPNPKFTMRQLFERSMEYKQDLYVCLLEYNKAFDNVRHERLMLHAIDIRERKSYDSWGTCSRTKQQL